MDFITNNWVLITAIAVPVLGIATIVVKRTKNKTDDKVVYIIKQIFNLSKFFKKK